MKKVFAVTVFLLTLVSLAMADGSGMAPPPAAKTRRPETVVLADGPGMPPPPALLFADGPGMPPPPALLLADGPGMPPPPGASTNLTTATIR